MTAQLLGLILALLPIYLWRFKIGVIPSTALEVLIPIFLASAFLAFLKNPKPALEKIKQLNELNWAVGLFLAASLIATIISPEPIKALGQLKAFIVEPVLLFYAAIMVIKKSDLKFLLLCLFGGAVVVSLFGLVQYLTLINLPLRFWGSGEEPRRIVSVFEYPNALALYLAPLLGFFIILWEKRYVFIKPIYLMSGILVMAAALMLTFSRGAWLAVILGILFFTIVSRNVKKLMLIGLTILILLIFVPAVRERLIISDVSTAAHGQLLTAGLNKIMENPFLGNGLYGFRTTLASQNFQGEILNYPHNIFLNFWLELGFLGILSLALIFYLALAQSKKQPHGINLAVGGYLLIMLLHGLVDVPYFKNDLAVLFWFMIFLAVFDKREVV